MQNSSWEGSWQKGMNKKKECLIVTELLPLYLEKQTGKHSNKYIEEHIKNCDECRVEMKYMTESYGKFTVHKEMKEQKLFLKKIKQRIIIGYAIILVIIWIFIFVCFM